jgi:NADH:ubiquinone oxidoreductase subunit 4 (subunit M)
MADSVFLIAAGIFLPLFPFSMLINVLYARVRQPAMRGVLLLAWPQIGLAIVFNAGSMIPSWVLAWALLTSLLYALRALALRELGLWTSFVATSAWALLWILLSSEADALQLQLTGFGISVPFVLMAMLGAGLERRFGAAYLGLYGGLAQSIPRFTGVLVVVILAIVATPLFPAFFAMLSMIIKTTMATPVIAMGIGVVWLLWSWAGARLLEGLITGPQSSVVSDLSQLNMWLYIGILAGLIFMGVYWLGAMT